MFLIVLFVDIGHYRPHIQQYQIPFQTRNPGSLANHVARNRVTPHTTVSICRAKPYSTVCIRLDRVGEERRGGQNGNQKGCVQSENGGWSGPDRGSIYAS